MKKLLFAAAVAVVSLHVYAQNDSVARQIDEVVVTGTRFQTDIRHLPMTVSVVNRQKLVENQRTNILPTLSEQVPGLFVSSRGMMGYGLNNGAGAISLRGIAAGSGQLLVLIDGHPQYQGIYGHPIGDAYQTMMAERVEVLRGPASVLYGSNAMGGVVNIVTRGMNTDGVRTNLHVGAGSYGTFQSELSNQVRSGRFSSTVAAGYSRSDNNRPNSGFEQYGGHLKLGYDLSQHWNAFIDADVTHFNASVPGTVQSPMLEWNQWATRGNVTAAIENHYERTSGRLSVYDNFGRHKINDGYAANSGKPRDRYFRSRDALAGVSLYQSFNLFEGNRLTLGFDYQHIYGRAFYTSRETGEVIDTPNKQSGHSHRNEIAGYADFRQDITPWLTIDAGLRVDYHNITGTEWVPQGGIVVRPTSDGELKLMASKGFRNATMREMYLYPPSNEDLEPERLMSYELSWKQRLFDGAFTYGVNLFYINADNMIQNTMVDGKPRNVNTGSTENSGFELEWAWRIDRHWQLNNNLSMLHMTNPIVGAPKLKTYLGANYAQCKWNVAAGLQYLSGLYTQVGSNATLEHVLLLNATVGYQLLRNVGLWVKGENLLARQYELVAGYPMPRATVMAGVNVTF